LEFSIQKVVCEIELENTTCWCNLLIFFRRDFNYLEDAVQKVEYFTAEKLEKVECVSSTVKPPVFGNIVKGIFFIFWLKHWFLLRKFKWCLDVLSKKLGWQALKLHNHESTRNCPAQNLLPSKLPTLPNHLKRNCLPYQITKREVGYLTKSHTLQNRLPYKILNLNLGQVFPSSFTKPPPL